MVVVCFVCFVCALLFVGWCWLLEYDVVVSCVVPLFVVGLLVVVDCCVFVIVLCALLVVRGLLCVAC